MKDYLNSIAVGLLVLLLTVANLSYTFAQCPIDVTNGQNLVTNGDFSQGYTGWTYTSDPARTTGYLKFDPPFTQNYSSPGFIHAGATPNVFNAAFTNFSDHTSTTTDNMMLMVDGLCALNAKLWQQTNIPTKPSTRYYFSVWINALKNGNNPPGQLQFEILNNGTTSILAPTILAPTSQGAWVKYEAFWDSPAGAAATSTISIENITTTGCDQYVDFAIDDISFIPGCEYADPGPTPNLGADKTLCGGNSPITLDAGIPAGSRTANTIVTWYDGTTNTGTNNAFYQKTNITLPGTYSVCVKEGPTGCTKSDVIVVSSTYSFDIGGPYELCNPISQLLDAQHSGSGVSYQWYYKTTAGAWVEADTIAGPSAKLRTYTANAAGRYRVKVVDNACGTQYDETTITTSATATPIDAHFCPPNKLVT